MSKTLAERIAEYNAPTLAWIAEDPTNRCATILVDDPEFWKEYGVETPEQFDRYMLVSTAWDRFKDVHGFRPRHVDFDRMSNQEIQGFIDRLKTEEDEGF